MKKLLIWMVLGLVACDPPADGDPTPVLFTGAVAVVTTTNYVVGSMAAVTLEDLAITDELLTTSGDPVVFARGPDVWQVNRSNASIRFFRLPDLVTPRLEISTGAGSNPRAAARCGDSLYVAILTGNQLLRFDAETGDTLTPVDLSAWADVDGNLEAQSLVEIDGQVFVSLGRLDRTTQPWGESEGGGYVLGINCVTQEVVWELATGPDCFITPSHHFPGQLLLTDGKYYDENEDIALDGGVAVIEPFITREVRYLAREEDLGGNFFGVADAAGDNAILLVVTDTQAEFKCLNVNTQEITALTSTLSFVPQIITAPDGLVWASLKAPYTDPASGGKILRFDPHTCKEVDADHPLTFSLDPFGISFAEGG